MVPDSPQEVHFLGLQRVSMLLPHFSQVKVAISFPPIIKIVQGSKFKVKVEVQRREVLVRITHSTTRASGLGYAQARRLCHQNGDFSDGLR
jgi:hypothetical protein